MLRPATVLMSAWSMPLTIANKLWLPVSIVWLVIASKWDLLAYGIGYDLLGSLVLSIALIPTLLLVPLANMLPNSRGITIGAGIIGIIYTNALITISCANVFYFLLARAPESLFWPVLLWAYGTAIMPWNFMADRDEGNPLARVTLCGVQSGCLILAISLVLFKLDWRGTIGVMADYMTLWTIVQVAYLCAMTPGGPVRKAVQPFQHWQPFQQSQQPYPQQFQQPVQQYQQPVQQYQPVQQVQQPAQQVVYGQVLPQQPVQYAPPHVPGQKP